VRRLAALALITFAAAGCMGDDEAVSRDDYIAKADALCGDYQVRLSRIPRPVTTEPAELGVFLERALPIAREQNEKLADLEKPDDEETRDQVEQLLDLLDQELDFNEAAQQAARAGDQAGLDSALQQATAVSAEAGQLAEQIGFVVCARRA
jgi:multidrug efflux pump subunit AcrA (membrane-fusion protein)